jgi:hypothetical protein
MPTTPKTTELIDRMLEALETPHKELSKWEEGFLDNLRDRRSRGSMLTDSQFEHLEKIYAEKTP